MEVEEADKERRRRKRRRGGQEGGKGDEEEKVMPEKEAVSDHSRLLQKNTKSPAFRLWGELGGRVGVSRG